MGEAFLWAIVSGMHNCFKMSNLDLESGLSLVNTLAALNVRLPVYKMGRIHMINTWKHWHGVGHDTVSQAQCPWQWPLLLCLSCELTILGTPPSFIAHIHLVVKACRFYILKICAIFLRFFCPHWWLGSGIVCFPMKYCDVLSSNLPSPLLSLLSSSTSVIFLENHHMGSNWCHPHPSLFHVCTQNNSDVHHTGGKPRRLGLQLAPYPRAEGHYFRHTCTYS